MNKTDQLLLELSLKLANAVPLPENESWMHALFTAIESLIPKLGKEELRNLLIREALCEHHLSTEWRLRHGKEVL